MVETPSVLEQTLGEFSTSGELSYVQTGNDPTDAPTLLENTFMSVLDAGQPTMGLTSAALLNSRIVTPLIVSEWSLALQNANLL